MGDSDGYVDLVVGFSKSSGCLTNENLAILLKGRYKIVNLFTRSVRLVLSRAKLHMPRRYQTLFLLIACSRPAKLSGFRSFAQTKTFLFPEGTAKGPTPAMTSQTASPG